ncbi:Pentatricopeptide repeat-containing protein [Zancudomyces culisetae]|uniref:Pentatricopeptide repeat-containing protein n=1 Tax=Zancudomyces culisetae TaxID=1213189 RepID=A0A1R1PN49_ZANCU|nr:Pentatricopeptide repeat-containing protein [Zancudomyces culisetae]|eukprot:OMH82361.1 Pentatricopeptide repeat-containing protein [Zancudomyces culisetae]
MNPLSSSTSLVPDLQTYTAIISAEVRANDWDAVYNLLVEMQDPKIDIKPDIVVRNIILEGIAKNKGMDEAMEEADNIKNKDGIPLDDASYSILLACALFNQRPEFVDKILKDCIAENKMPSVHSLSVSFVTLNTSTSTSTGFSPSQLLSKILELGGKPNEQIFSRLLYKSIKANNYKEAQLIYKLTEENVGKMSISLYGIIIEALCKNKKFEHVKTVFKEMLANDVVPDSYIFYSIMSNCCTDKSQMLYWQSVFRPLNIKYSVHCYNALSKLYIKFYNEGIAFTKVLFTITEMLENLDNEYDITSFNLLFQSINNALLYANRSESNREFVNKVFLNTFSKYKQFTNSITASSPVNIQIASFVDYWYKRKLLPLSEASSSISTATSPDHTTFVHLLDIYTTLNITGYAHSMYVSIPKNILTKILLLKSQSTLNNLMNMFLFHKRYDYVSQVWIDRIKLSYYNIDPVAVAIMLRTCDQQGHILAAKQNFESLLKSHDLPFLISQNSLAFSISTISKNSTPVFCVDAKVIYLYVALLIKYRLLSEIMPAINLWYKTVSSSSLTPDRNRDKQSEGDTAVDSLDDKVYYNNPFTLFDDFSDNEYQDLDFAAAVPNRATLPQHIVSGIISALNDPSLTTESNGENIKIQGEFLRFVEARFPLSVPI